MVGVFQLNNSKPTTLVKPKDIPSPIFTPRSVRFPRVVYTSEG